MPWVPVNDSGLVVDLHNSSGNEVSMSSDSIVTGIRDSDWQNQSWLVDVTGHPDEILQFRIRRVSWESQQPENEAYLPNWYGNVTGTVFNQTADNSDFTPSDFVLESEKIAGKHQVSFTGTGGPNISEQVQFLIEIWLDIDTDDLVANDDFAEVQSGSSVTVDVLANDTLNGEPVSTSSIDGPFIVSGPSDGFAEVTEDGQISYWPPEGFVGTVQIEYEIESRPPVEA